jgi:hypothetical protein
MYSSSGEPGWADELRKEADKAKRSSRIGFGITFYLLII